MRSVRVLVCLGTIAFGGCTASLDPNSPAPHFASSESAIVNGTKDTVHTAVVAVLGQTQGGFDECSGTIVQVKNGEAYVLTAAHCCNMSTPSLVIMANDYSQYEQYLGDPNPPAPAYAVEPGSVSYDKKYNGQDHDFCMLKFAGANASTPVIPVPLPNQDGISNGVDVEFVGFGMLSGTQQNSIRYHGTAPVDQGVNSLVIQYTEGQGGVPGPCEGDSGGPALIPAGAPPSQQKVVATTSYGDQSCSQYGVSSRVTSETGPGGFIYNYLGLSSSSTTGSGCTSNSQCSGATPICDKTTGACRGCTSNSDCPTGSCATAANDPSVGRCVQCTSDSDCGTGTCDTSTDTCAACQSSAQCGQLQPVCDASTQTCKGCSNDSDCSGNTHGRACETQGSLAGACVSCTATNTSACSGATPACDDSTGSCVECMKNSDCTDPTKPGCDTRTHTCTCIFAECGPGKGGGAPAVAKGGCTTAALPLSSELALATLLLGILTARRRRPRI